PPGIEDDDYDSERDILILKDLPSNDTLLIPEKESFHFDIPSFSRPPAKPPDVNTGILNIKMMGDIFDQKVPMHKLIITLILNQEKSPDLLSHQGLKTFQPSAKWPMMIHGKNNPILDELYKNHRIQLLPIEHSAHVEDIVEFETAIAQTFLYLRQELFRCLLLRVISKSNKVRNNKDITELYLYGSLGDCV
nr:hypothetical protein [Tanacetum cinerariifolium]